MLVRCYACGQTYSHFNGHKCRGKPSTPAAVSPTPKPPTLSSGEKAKPSIKNAPKRILANQAPKPKRVLIPADQKALAQPLAQERRGKVVIADRPSGNAARVARWREKHPDEWQAIHREQERKRRAKLKSAQQPIDGRSSDAEAPGDVAGADAVRV